ncbi:hypothetical protein AVEN_154802-1 [Araneus ventricosus]|uniref:Uncharacterized protein n=1 Tax=Araneus ventricosus TaxID=182803 RepID=A0A4Y2BUI3_ARAVE|nr:hypothetical protein AVEN_154802-1 [Araneus ventricosus]
MESTEAPAIINLPYGKITPFHGVFSKNRLPLCSVRLKENDKRINQSTYDDFSALFMWCTASTGGENLSIPESEEHKFAVTRNVNEGTITVISRSSGSQ